MTKGIDKIDKADLWVHFVFGLLCCCWFYCHGIATPLDLLWKIGGFSFGCLEGKKFCAACFIIVFFWVGCKEGKVCYGSFFFFFFFFPPFSLSSF
jgi:hypothetical protein